MDLNKLITVLVEQVYEIFEADPILSMKLINSSFDSNEDNQNNRQWYCHHQV